MKAKIIYSKLDYLKNFIKQKGNEMHTIKRSLKLLLFAVLPLTMFLISCLEEDLTKQKLSETDIKEISSRSEVVFKENCAGCHGSTIKAFANENWDFGNTPEAIYASIANGRNDGEMPGFKGVLEDQQIKEMVVSILHSSDKLNEYNFHSITEQSEIYKAKDFRYKIEKVVDELQSPWGMAFLPSGDMLVTDKTGDLWRVGKMGIKTKILGVPSVKFERQGGLMDVELHPDFINNNYIYISYSSFKPGNNDLSSTSVMRFKLTDDKLTEGKLIFEALPYTNTGHHYGSRIEFDNNGYLFITVGDRGKRDEFPQDLSVFPGKVHRVFDDGRIPENNPFVNTPGAVKSIYSYGHRNQQGMIKNPISGEIWTHEHGPRGGDEINIVRKGLNYGWPVISYGINYSGTKFTELTTQEGMEQPLHQWTPSIAPSGMDFVRGDLYPGWQGALLVGSLKYKFLGLYKLENEKVISEEKILSDKGRVRNVKQGPDNYIYVAIEEPGVIYKIVPVKGG